MYVSLDLSLKKTHNTSFYNAWIVQHNEAVTQENC
jgi:hypothetical protein